MPGESITSKRKPTSANGGQMWGTVQASEDVGHQPFIIVLADEDRYS